MTIQNIPQGAGWFGALNSNFSYTKQQLDNLGFKNAGQVITYLNGASAKFSDLFYSQIAPNVKLCVLSIGWISCNTGGTDIFKIASNYAPSHVVSASANEQSFVGAIQAGGTDTFKAWSINNAGIANGGVSAVWLHFD